MQRAPAWRLWTGVALATLVVWMIVSGGYRHERQARRDASILPLIAMEAVFRAVRELAEALFELGRVLRIGRDARAHHGRLRIPQFEQHLQFLP